MWRAIRPTRTRTRTGTSDGRRCAGPSCRRCSHSLASPIPTISRYRHCLGGPVVRLRFFRGTLHAFNRSADGCNVESNVVAEMIPATASRIVFTAVVARSFAACAFHRLVGGMMFSRHRRERLGGRRLPSDRPCGVLDANTPSPHLPRRRLPPWRSRASTMLG